MTNEPRYRNIDGSVNELADALDHIGRVAANARQSTRRLRWIVQRVKSALAGDDDWKHVEIPRHDPAIERLETLIVSVYQIVKAELGARRDLYEGEDGDIPDEVLRREVEVLDRFINDSRRAIAVLRTAEGEG